MQNSVLYGASNKCMRSNSVPRVRHAASNTEDGLPVDIQYYYMAAFHKDCIELPKLRNLIC